MTTISINLRLYELHELPEKAQAKAIEEHRQFMLSIMNPSDFISGDPEYDTTECLENTYLIEYEYVLSHDDAVIDSITANNYLFYHDGTLANATRYYGDHPLKGYVSVAIHGDTYRNYIPPREERNETE